MAYDDAASQAALAVAKSVLQDAVKAAGVVKVASQAVADAVVGAEQARDEAVAATGQILFSSTYAGEAKPAVLTLRPIADGSTIYGLVLLVQA
jgi:hypothetical protein